MKCVLFISLSSNDKKVCIEKAEKSRSFFLIFFVSSKQQSACLLALHLFVPIQGGPRMVQTVCHYI